MIPYLGDFAEGDTIYLMFNTFTSDDPSASCTITNLLNTDVHIHKDDGLTQRNNAAGITVSTNFDGITGSHLIKIDTNDNTVAGFWVTGADYFVRIEGTTVDAATINAVVGHFSIQNRFMRGTNSAALAATALTDATWTDARAGYLDNLSAGAVALASGVDLTSIHGAALTETVGGYLAAAFVKLFDVATPLLVASEVMRGTDGANTTVPDAAGTLATYDPPTNTEMVAAFTEIKGATWAAGTDTLEHIRNKQTDIETDTAEIGTAGAGLTDLGGMSTGMKAEVQTEANDALIAQNLDHLMKVAVDTDWATTVHLDSAIGHMADVGTAATFNRTTDALEAIRNRGDAAWVTGAGGSDRLLMVDTTIATLASQTSFTLTAGSADNDAYNNCTIIIEDAATATQKAMGIVSAYTGATKTVTLEYDPAVFAMAVTDKVYILAENALKATLANRQLNVAADGDIAGNVDGSIASLVGHTAQTGDSFARLGAPAGASIAADLLAIDNFVDDLESRLTATRAGYLDNLSVGAVALASALTTAQADLDTITGSDGVTLATAQALYAPNKVVPDAAGTAAGLHTTTDGKVDVVDANVDAILVDTDTTIPAQIAALDDISVADIIAGISDGTLDLQEMMRIILAATACKSAGGGTVTIYMRDSADSKNRIVATVDGTGNRTAVTLDGS